MGSGGGGAMVVSVMGLGKKQDRKLKREGDVDWGGYWEDEE